MDHTKIQELLGLASNAVGTTDNITGTITALKKLVDEGSIKAGTEEAKLIEQLFVNSSIVAVTSKQLLEAVRNLSSELQKTEAFEVEKARYEMVETDEGDYVFRIKDHMADEQPVHYICPICLNQDKLISYIAGRHRKVCQINRKHAFNFGKKPPIVRTRVRH